MKNKYVVQITKLWKSISALQNNHMKLLPKLQHVETQSTWAMRSFNISRISVANGVFKINGEIA